MGVLTMPIPLTASSVVANDETLFLSSFLCLEYDLEEKDDVDALIQML